MKFEITNDILPLYIRLEITCLHFLASCISYTKTLSAYVTLASVSRSYHTLLPIITDNKWTLICERPP